MKVTVIAFAFFAVASTSAIAYYAREDASRGVALPAPMTFATVRDPSADITRLAAEVATLRRELASRAATTAQPPTSAPVAPVQIDDGPVLDPRSDAAALAAAERQFDEHTATIATTFSGEARDPSFALNTSDSLRVVLDSDELAKMPVQTIDCRTTTCRVEIGDDGSGVVPQVLPMLMVRMADTLPNVTAQRLEQPNGRATMVLYMSK